MSGKCFLSDAAIVILLHELGFFLVFDATEDGDGGSQGCLCEPMKIISSPQVREGEGTTAVYWLSGGKRDGGC